ncbi:hypothetical protein CAPTEDRAFT_201346, partial [Capitella teleta]
MVPTPVSFPENECCTDHVVHLLPAVSNGSNADERLKDTKTILLLKVVIDLEERVKSIMQVVEVECFPNVKSILMYPSSCQCVGYEPLIVNVEDHQLTASSAKMDYPAKDSRMT